MKAKTKTTMRDQISATAPRVVKVAREGEVPRRKRLGLPEFLGHVLAEIDKAGSDEPKVAKRRLTVLKRNVDGVLAAIDKLDAEDAGEDFDIEVTTAFVPTEAEGDAPMEELTTGSDQSSSEVPLGGGDGGEGTFATNLDEVDKALAKATKVLGQEKRAPVKKAGGDSWPLDLNTEAFREGVEKSDAGPAWGYDPKEVAATKVG